MTILLFSFLYLVITLISRLLYIAKYPIESKIINILFDGFIFDLTTLSYIIIIPLIIDLFIKTRHTILEKFNKIYFSFMLTITCFIELINYYLIEEWGSVLNVRGLFSIIEYNELIISIKPFLSLYVMFIVFLLILLVIFILKNSYIPINYKVINLIILPLSLIMLRGGVQKIPINSSVCFQNHSITDGYIVLNKTYFLIENVVHFVSKNNKTKLKNEEFENLKLDFFPEIIKNDTIFKGIFENKPVVLLILEGVLYDALQKDTSLFLTKLKNKSIDFSSVYSSGFRTDQGLLSILNGYPANHTKNMLKDNDFIDSSTSLFHLFKKANYKTSFYYGGDMNFSNFNYYMKTNEVDHIISNNMFNDKQHLLDWGYDEEIVLEKFHQDINNTQGLFFNSILTLSTHPPFDIEINKNIEDTETKYLNTIHFIDQAIHNFFKKAAIENWFEETVFIFVSDHGSLYLNQYDFNNHERFHVPFFIYNYQTKPHQISTLSNTHDIPATICHLFNFESPFKYSKNIFNLSYPYSYWITENTIGWKESDFSVVIHQETKDVYFHSGKSITETEINKIIKFKHFIEYTYQND
jgi:hypothetical protein